MNWISAAEKLPPYGVDVIVAFKSSDYRAAPEVGIAKRTHTDAKGEHYNMDNKFEVTHWMHKPKHPDA